MKMFAFLRQHFLDEKLSLHAGELVGGLVPPEDLRYHITEAVMVAGANRIGHGVDIANEANALELLKTLKQRNIAIEVNLSSNDFILGVKNEAHPVLLYKKYGVPFVISSDDAGVSRTDLSGEYLLFISRYKPSYDELKAIVYNSIKYSFLTDTEKSEEMAKLDDKFLNFESLIATAQNSVNLAKKLR
jgi:adenosine deaminase/adenosine deaminase CECR1